MLARRNSSLETVVPGSAARSLISCNPQTFAILSSTACDRAIQGNHDAFKTRDLGRPDCMPV